MSESIPSLEFLVPPAAAANPGFFDLIDLVLRRRSALLDLLGELPGLRLLARMGLISAVLVSAFGASLGVGRSFIAIFAGGIGMPILLGASIVITFPLLYVFYVYYGSRAYLAQMLGVVMVSIMTSSIILAGFVPVMVVFRLALANQLIVTGFTLVMIANAGYHGLITFVRGIMRIDGATPEYLRFRLIVALAWTTIYLLVFVCMAQMLAAWMKFQPDVPGVFRF